MSTPTPTQTGDLDLDLDRLLDALQQLRYGDLSVRLPEDGPGRVGMVARVFNSLATLLEQLSAESIRITDEVGKQGRFGGQAEVDGAAGRWSEMVDSLNLMALGLTYELRGVSQLAQAWASGDTNLRHDPRYIAGEFAEMQQRLNDAADHWTRPRAPRPPAV